VDEPGPVDGAGVLEDADGLVAEDLGVGGEQGDEVGPEAARRADLVRDDDVAGVEDVQEGGGQPAGEDLGVVVVLDLLVDLVEELDVVDELDGVVALRVVEVEPHRAGVDEQVERQRVGVVLAVGRG
jgi:hypothetical protein